MLPKIKLRLQADQNEKKRNAIDPNGERPVYEPEPQFTIDRLR